LVGWFVSLILTMLLSLYKIYCCTQVKVQFGNCFLKPLLAGLAAGLVIRYVIQIGTPSKMFFLLCISAVMLLYILFLMLLGCLKKELLQTLKL